MVTYSTSIAQRVPALSGPPSLTEIGPLHASGLSWGTELRRQDSGTATVAVESLEDDVKEAVKQAIQGQATLELWTTRNDDDGNTDLVHQGKLMGHQVQGTGDVWTFVSLGILEYLHSMKVGADGGTIQFSGVDQHLIVKTLIDEWQARDYGHFGLDTSTITTSGVPRDRTQWRFGDDVFQRVTELAEADNGFDISVNADRQIILEAAKGSDLTADVVLDRRGITDAGIAVSYAADDLASEAYAANTDEENPLTATRSNATLRQAIGRMGVFASYDGVTDQTTLNDKAALLRDTRQAPMISPTPQLLPVSGAGPTDFDVGDVVQFDPSMGLDLVLDRRVIRKTVKVGDDGNESISVELADA